MVVAAMLNFLAAVPIFGFPFQLPGGAKARMDDMRDKMARKGRYAESEFRDIQVDAPVMQSLLKSCWVSVVTFFSICLAANLLL